jgi:hypothetical protein
MPTTSDHDRWTDMKVGFQTTERHSLAGRIFLKMTAQIEQLYDY